MNLTLFSVWFMGFDSILLHH